MSDEYTMTLPKAQAIIATQANVIGSQSEFMTQLRKDADAVEAQLGTMMSIMRLSRARLRILVDVVNEGPIPLVRGRGPMDDIRIELGNHLKLVSEKWNAFEAECTTRDDAYNTTMAANPNAFVVATHGAPRAAGPSRKRSHP